MALRRLFRWIRHAVIAYCTIVIGLTILYLMVPPVSTLMAWRWVTGSEVSRQFVPLEETSIHVVSSVIVAEDSRFCEHHGVDWQAMGDVIDGMADGERPRGASTLSMQVVKNLFLWPQRSYIRKVIELPLALMLDLVWSKRQMLEVYLNIAELGDGIFGIDAAAMHYFGKSATTLTRREAAMLAASLPGPLIRNPDKQTSFFREQTNRILTRSRMADTNCL